MFSPTKGTELNNKYRLEITPSHGNFFIFLTIKCSNATYTSSVLCSPFYIGAFLTYSYYIHIYSYLPISPSPPPLPPPKPKIKKRNPMLLVLLFYVDYFCLSSTILMLFVALFYALTMLVLFLFIIFCELVAFLELI